MPSGVDFFLFVLRVYCRFTATLPFTQQGLADDGLRKHTGLVAQATAAHCCTFLLTLLLPDHVAM